MEITYLPPGPREALPTSLSSSVVGGILLLCETFGLKFNMVGEGPARQRQYHKETNTNPYSVQSRTESVQSFFKWLLLLQCLSFAETIILYIINYYSH